MGFARGFARGFATHALRRANRSGLQAATWKNCNTRSL
jgi:hypothetical protein